ncbi:hypothetical protein C2G38_2036201 [Gigaspora rosea]|uniref:Uncharacterized protein n=1 Tax=Gigaspora rosea TaxID=44941 RepID=A0A397VH52_9GLOM|nr:hypothetical protein C2G38_2036201 [Gigaspora rosea]
MNPARKQKKLLKKESRFLSRTIANIEKKREVAVKQLQTQAVVISSEEYVERSQGARSVIARDFLPQNSKKRNQEDVLEDDPEKKNAVKKCKDTTPAPPPQTPENQVIVDEPETRTSPIYEDEDKENSLDGSSDEDIVELADISFNSFVGSNTDNKNYNWKLKNNESVRDLSSEFKQGMHSWFNDDWIPLKDKALSKINLTVEEFSGKILEFITKVENVYRLYYPFESHHIMSGTNSFAPFTMHSFVFRMIIWEQENYY